MATITVIKRSRPNKDGTYPLQLRVVMNRKPAFRNIGESVESKHWDDQANQLKSSHPNFKYLDILIQDKISEAKKHMLKLEVLHSDYTLQMLMDNVDGKHASSMTFMTMAKEYFKEMEDAGDETRAQGERPVINHLKKYSKGRNLHCHDLTVAYLKKFKAYLKGLGSIGDRSMANYLLTMRTIYNRCIQCGAAKQEYYPFGKGKIQIKKPESQKIGLEHHEVEQLENLKLDPESFLEHTRKFWLFSFYMAGMRVSDELLLRWSNIAGARLYYTMGKNKKPGSVIIPDQAMEILEYYSKLRQINCPLVFPDMRGITDLNNKKIVKPLLKNRAKKINKHLKMIAEMIDLEKPLTMHIARHTFGNIAGDKIPLTVLQQLYRHSSITTTINYQKAFMNKGTDKGLLTVVNFKRKEEKNNPKSSVNDYIQTLPIINYHEPREPYQHYLS